MPKLCVVNGIMVGETFDIEAPETVLGRAPDADIVVDDDRVSRHHCRLIRTGDGIEVEDLGSSNGTVVNGAVVKRARLLDGDELRVGNHIFSVMGAKDPAAASDSVTIMPEHRHDTSTSVEVMAPEDTTDFLEHHLAHGQASDRMLRDLRLIYRASYLINAQRDPDELFITIMDLAFEAVNAERGYLVLSEADERLLVKVRRFRHPSGRKRLSISRSVVDTVLAKGQAVMVNDAMKDQRFSSRESVVANSLRSVLCVPLKCQDKVLGFIFVDNPTMSGAFSTDDLRLMAGIAVQAGVAIENCRLFRAVEDIMFGSIGALVAAIEAKDQYIRGHSERVANISRAVAEEMSLPYELIKTIHLAALLHDIGKIGLSESILNKEGHLDDAERALVHEHSGRGAEILRNITNMAEVAKAVRHHHEHWNGEGYPSSLAGRDIPLASRIIAVADSYDAMTSERPYRGRLTHESCVGEIVRCSGQQFDPEVVEALLKWARRGRSPVPMKA